MDALTATHMVEELQENLKTRDATKARLVLAHIGQVDPPTQNRLIYALLRGDPEFTTPLLLFLVTEYSAVTDSMPVVRETLLSNLLATPELLLKLLDSPAIKHKGYLIQVVGELRLKGATPILIKLAAATSNEKEILQIIETLGLVGDPQAINTLTDFLYAANHDLISAAVQSLGLVGTPTAMYRLAERMGTDNELDSMILSIFANVQDQVSLDKLNDTLRSHYAHMRTFAKKKLISIGPKAVPNLIQNMLHDDPDFLIHTLNILGDIGDESAINPVRKLLANEPRDANVRFAAYEALALLPLKKGAYTLTNGLTDKEDHVCVAAARAIDQNYSEILEAGIRNLIRNKDDDARHIAKIIVNAQVDKIFLSLARDEVFQELALIYLPHAHKDIRDHYQLLLLANNITDFAGKVGGEVRESAKPKVVAIDDSRMILNIYKATLHELGFDPVLFEFPASAIEWLQKEKPLLVLTDLNMPDITGVQLTERVRKQYSPQQLPIIMVTTQNEAQDNEAATKAGVNKIINKPFNAKSLKAAMDEFLR